MTECNSCGGCCDPVPLPFTQDEIRRLLPSQMAQPEDRWFILNVLRPISRREGLRRASYMQGRTCYGTAGGGALILETRFYECAWFDKETRRCTNYDERPFMCRSYPWYTGEPDEAAALPLECSYRADIGQPVAIRQSSAG